MRPLLFALCVAACGPGPELMTAEPAAMTPAPAPAPAQQQALGASRAMQAAGAPAALGQGVAGGGVAAVFAVHAASGTVSQSGYSAEPADRLVVVGADGKRATFQFITLQGDLAHTAEDFFKNDHQLQVHFTSEGNDFTVSSGQSNGQTVKALKGFFTLEGVRYDADVASGGWSKSKVELDYASRESQDVTKGTVQGGGLSVTLDEDYWFNFIFSSGSGVTNTIRTTRDRWTDAGHAWAAQAEIKESKQNGKPIELDTYWRVAGVITRDGAQVGTVGMSNDNLALTVWVELEGMRTTLERYLW